MEDEKLVELVRSFSCLWNVQSKGYRDIIAKENAWKEVSSQMEGMTADDCIRRWRSLRDKFVRENKKVKKRKSGEEGPCYVSNWPLYNIMLFIGDTVKHRDTVSNLPTLEVSSRSTTPINNLELPDQVDDDYNFTDTDDNESGVRAVSSDKTTPIKLPATKRKNSSQKRDEVEELMITELKEIQKRRTAKELTDDEGYFGQHVAATLRKFNDRQKAIAKLQIEQLLVNIEFPSDPYPKFHQHYEPPAYEI